MTTKQISRIRECIMVLKQINRIETKLDILLKGHSLLTANRALDKQDANEKKDTDHE